MGYALALRQLYSKYDPTMCIVPTMHKANCCFKIRKHSCLNLTSSWFWVSKQCTAAKSAMIRTVVLLSCENLPCFASCSNATLSSLDSVSHPPQPVLTSIKFQRQDSLLTVANVHSLMSRSNAIRVIQCILLSWP